jgi:hypothetical protein
MAPDEIVLQLAHHFVPEPLVQRLRPRVEGRHAEKTLGDSRKMRSSANRMRKLPIPRLLSCSPTQTVCT